MGVTKKVTRLQAQLQETTSLSKKQRKRERKRKRDQKLKNVQPKSTETEDAREHKPRHCVEQNVQLQFQKRQMHAKHKLRVQRILKTIVGSGKSKRRFSGTITIADRDASVIQAQSHLSQDPVDSECVYWVDGSYSAVGALGAGVVWRNSNENWGTKSLMLGQHTGNANDAELYAIAAALELAVEKAKSTLIKSVIIYSDSSSNLINLRELNKCSLGPVISLRWALEDVLDRADWLTQARVEVHLRWVKGHSECMGNQRAHQIATNAARQQGGIPNGLALPQALQAASKDVQQEFFFQVARSWLLKAASKDVQQQFSFQVARSWLLKPSNLIPTRVKVEKATKVTKVKVKTGSYVLNSEGKSKLQLKQERKQALREQKKLLRDALPREVVKHTYWLRSSDIKIPPILRYQVKPSQDKGNTKEGIEERKEEGGQRGEEHGGETTKHEEVMGGVGGEQGPCLHHKDDALYQRTKHQEGGSVVDASSDSIMDTDNKNKDSIPTDDKLDPQELASEFSGCEGEIAGMMVEQPPDHTLHLLQN